MFAVERTMILSETNVKSEGFFFSVIASSRLKIRVKDIAERVRAVDDAS